MTSLAVLHDARGPERTSDTPVIATSKIPEPVIHANHSILTGPRLAVGAIPAVHCTPINSTRPFEALQTPKRIGDSRSLLMDVRLKSMQVENIP